jgi:ligand-binding sensor domain-containing protein/signal transduction histidine kinase
MSKKNLAFLIPILLLTASCGTANPVPTPTPRPPASILEPQPAAAPSGQFQPNTYYSQNIRFEHISLDEGLSQSAVNAILQDRTGYLWFGTQDGLNRYDGYNFKIYKPDPNNPDSISDRWITALVEDEQGYLWVGTRLGGINRYNPLTDTFTRFLHDENDPQSLGNNEITSLVADEDGLWIGTEYGLDYLDYNTQKFSHYRSATNEPSGLSSNSITDLFKDSRGNLWIGTTNAGLNQYNEKTHSFQVYKYSEENPFGISHNRILTIAEDVNGSIWVGTANGLNKFDPSSKLFTRYFYEKDNPQSVGGNTIFAIYRDRSGSLWLSTNNSLDRYDAQANQFIHHKHQNSVTNSLSNNTVQTIYEDRSNVLWIGTFGSGLDKYNREQDKFIYYRNNPEDENSLSGDMILPIAVDTNGLVWIGTQGAGLNRFNPNTNEFTHYRYDPSDLLSLSSDDVIALEIDHKGNLWVGTNHGLDLFNSRTQTFSRYQPPLPLGTINSPVSAIHEDNQHKLWVAINRDLYVFDPDENTFSPYGANEKEAGPFNGNLINVIFNDQAGNLWLGTFNDGLKRIKPGNSGVMEYTNDPQDNTTLGNNSIMSIYQDRAGTLWIGTGGGGLNRYNYETDTFTRFTEQNGLPNDVIYGILEDDKGNLWLSTNFGLSRFNVQKNSFRNFTTGDGLQSNEFNQYAYAKDLSGRLYFGGINGLNVFLPKNIKDNPYPPPVVLTSLTLDGEPLNQETTTEYLKNITLTWPLNSFEFEFIAFTYGQPTKNQYAYKLEGFDESWNEIKNKRNGRYTNLPGGTYTLLLRGSNSDGVWNNQGQSIQITVVPPFWATWWFRVLSLLGLGVAIAVGLRWRVKNVENRNRQLESVVRKRTADLEKRTREIEALYQADEKILRNVTLNQVFQTLMDVSVSMLKADRSVVFAWSEEENKIVPRVSYGFRPETLQVLTFEEGEGMVGQAMKTGEPVIVYDLKIKELREDIQTAIRIEHIQSFAHFPIVVDGKVVAIFNVAYTRPNALHEDNIRLFNALVHRASLSIANMQLFEQTKDLAVMEERNRLARDLHDSAKQKAFAALAQLGTANGMWKAKSDGIEPHLTEAETLVYEVIQELTFLVQEIYPIALQEKGLPTTLREYIFEWEGRNDTVVNLTIRNERSLPLETEQAIYRVIQEALANISRHSKAKRADISLVYNHDSLQVNISDDGCGFDMTKKAKGLGFRSMRERISSIRGNLQIQSAPGQGTRLIVQVPIKQTAGVETL